MLCARRGTTALVGWLLPRIRRIYVLLLTTVPLELRNRFHVVLAPKPRLLAMSHVTRVLLGTTANSRSGL